MISTLTQGSTLAPADRPQIDTIAHWPHRDVPTVMPAVNSTCSAAMRSAEFGSSAVAPSGQPAFGAYATIPADNGSSLRLDDQMTDRKVVDGNETAVAFGQIKGKQFGNHTWSPPGL